MINKSYFSLWKRVGPGPDFVVRSKLILESGGGEVSEEEGKDNPLPKLVHLEAARIIHNCHKT